MLRIGLLGGTFDPIHYGHLRIAEVVGEACALDQIWFIPCGHPPLDKDYDLSPGEDRYAMALLAAGPVAHFEVLRLEIERSGPSFTVDTVEELQRRWAAGAEFSFIMGADSLQQLRLWHRYQDLVRKCPLIIVNRPGYDLSQGRAEVEAMPGARLQIVEMEGLGISATGIRAWVQQGRSIRYLTPEPVIAYIGKRRLYRAEGPEPGKGR